MHKLKEGRLVTVWPEDLKQWSQMRSREGEMEIRKKAVRITRPQQGSQLFLPKGANRLRLFISAESEGEEYWYLDGRFVAKNSEANGIFIDVPVGRHRLSVLANEESDMIEFEVASLNDKEKKGTQDPVVLNE